MRGSNAFRTIKPCVHCRIRVSYYGRGLCKACHADLEVRGSYPPREGYRPPKVPIPVGGYRSPLDPPLNRYPSEPTNALPGSEEKIRVMGERASRGEGLFHPNDAEGIDSRIYSIEYRKGRR